MAAPGDIYERELKAILGGEEKALSKVTRTCNLTETKYYQTMGEKPFLVIRAAGSLGVDLVALRWDYSFPIEVKSSQKNILYMSKSDRLGDQAERMLETCAKSHIIPIYAFRLKGIHGDPWRIFTIPSNESLNGSSAVLRNNIPYLEVSKNGNYIMRWEEGLKLSDFIHIMDGTEYVGSEDEILPYEEECASGED